MAEFVRNAEPALLSAIRAVSPDWFRLPVEEAIRFRLLCEGRTHSRIELEVARTEFGRPFRSMRDLKALTGKGEENRARDRFNELMMPFYGVGIDSFWINEILPNDDLMTDYVTLEDYDRADYVAQRMHRGDDLATAFASYSGSLSWAFVRWLEDARLVYGHMHCALPSVREEVVDTFDDRIFERFPYGIEWTPEQVCGGFTTSSPVVDRPDNGRRSTLAGLLVEVAVGSLAETVLGSIENDGPFVVDTAWEESGVANRKLVFSGPKALRSVRTTAFTRDLARLADGSARLEAARSELLALAETRFEGLLDRVDATPIDDIPAQMQALTAQPGPLSA